MKHLYTVRYQYASEILTFEFHMQHLSVSCEKNSIITSLIQMYMYFIFIKYSLMQ